MEVLILSCSTGGGHNAAAEALREECERRGDRVVFMDPYALRSDRAVRLVSGTYVSLVQKAPRLFGVAYTLGELVRRLPWRSPVYFVNRKAARAMEHFLSQNHFDVVLMPHLFPAEIMTCLKNRGVPLPKTVFVATDYTCIPFTEETDCDAYVIPHADLLGEFEGRGIPREKLYPLGIPVRRAFRQEATRAAARKALGLDPDETYLLVSGGSMGAGVLKRAVRELSRQFGAAARLIVICGTNRRLYRSLGKKYGPSITLLQTTDQMALYLSACDLYLTKPGGLSTTEAAVVGLPLVALHPIPGCETKNARFFTSHQFAVSLSQIHSGVDPDLWSYMAQQQRENVPPDSAERICDLARRLAEPKPAQTTP